VTARPPPAGIDPEDRFIVDDLKCETGLEASLNDVRAPGLPHALPAAN
jgi:hypothetical protein